jgi:hypothetical protein
VNELLVATFSTVHFRQWRTRWFGAGVAPHAGTSHLEDVLERNEGALAVFDSASGECLGSMILDTPTGFAFGPDHLYVNSMYGNRTVCLDRCLTVTDSVSHRLMSDLHTVAANEGRLLVTSSGVDAILEVAMDGTLTWAWFARERGYPETERGPAAKVDKRADYRGATVSTKDQSTHCNSALPACIAGRQVILATLFHQGELVAIDRATGSHEVLVTGMGGPHSVRRRPGGGWLVSDTEAGAVVVLDDDFWVTEVIERDFNWVQDAVDIGDGRILVADANNYRFVEWDLAGRCARGELRYSRDWKVFQVDVVDERWAEALVHALAGRAEARVL